MPLTRLAVDTLRILVQKKGTVVPKDSLINEVWPGGANDSSLTRNISDLRRVLGRSYKGRIIETIHGRGYRLVLEVEEHEKTDESLRKTIAILPLMIMEGSTFTACTGLSIADSLIGKLVSLRICTVCPTSDVARYQSTKKRAVEVGRELGVQYVLDGRLENRGDTVRATVQLLSTNNGAPVWAETFEEKTAMSSRWEDSISDELAGALILLLGTDQRKLRSKEYTSNTEAYQLYLRGRFHLSLRSEPEIRKAIGFFRRALSIDPEYAPASSALANSYSLLPMVSLLPAREFMPKARAAAVNALDIDDTLVEARSALAFIKWHYDCNWKGAEQEFCRILKFHPDDAMTHQWYALLLVELGRFSEAIAEARRAQHLDPSSSIRGNVAIVLHLAGRYDEAISEARSILELEPGCLRARLALGLALEQKEMVTEAIRVFEQGDAVSRRVPLHRSALGHCYILAGRIDEARDIVKSLETATRPRYIWQSLLHFRLGREDRALELLEKARYEREFEMVLLKVDKRFNGLHTHPRFQAVLRQIGLSK